MKVSLGKRVALILSTVAVLIGALIYFDLDVLIISILTWLDELGSWAPLLFMAIDCAFVVLLLPGVLLTLGAGFLFGVLKGSAYVVVATTIGASIAFLVARYLLSNRISAFFLNHPRLRIVKQEFSRNGREIILLTRLVPFFTFKLSNYFFGFAGFRLGDFLFGTFFGIIPITIFNVYIGSLAGDLATLGIRDTTRSPLQWIIYGAGFIATIIAFVYINNRAQHILNAYLAQEGRKELAKRQQVAEEPHAAEDREGGAQQYTYS